MTHGHDQHYRIIRPNTNIDVVQYILRDITLMGSHHALWTSRGPRRIHNIPDIRRIDDHIRLAWCPFFHEILKVEIPIGRLALSHIDVILLRNRQLIPHAIYHFHKLLCHQEGLALGMVDDVLDFRGGQAKHDGNGNLSPLGGCGVDLHPFDAIVSQNGKTIPLSHPQIG